MRIIGLCGAAGSGKDTAASIIAELTPDRVKRQGFADKLKLSAARLFIPDATVEEGVEFCNRVKTHGYLSVQFRPDGAQTISGREFLQRFGTEAHREVFGPAFWLDAVLPPGRNDCDLLLIPDVRFPNEAERIHERGGEVWQINRLVEAVESHASETPIPDKLIHAYVDNTGTLQDLRREVAALLTPAPLAA